MVEPLRRLAEVDRGLARRARSGAAVGARTPEPQRGEDKRYHYYVSRSPGASPSYAVFVCDHAYDCEPLCQEASEQEVIALIGTDALRAAQDCRRLCESAVIRRTALVN